MAKKSGMEHVSDLARHAKALKDIIKAAMSGGWQAAALQALKHYWPQILTAALILLLLPVIIFACLPSMLFGFGGSNDAEVDSMTKQAEVVQSYYDRYDDYCSERVEKIKKIADGESESGGAGETTSESSAESAETYDFVNEGAPMEKNWFIALYSVKCGNDVYAVTEDGVRSFVAEIITYEITDKKTATETTETVQTETTSQTGSTDTESSTSNTVENTKKDLTVLYLSPEEYMTQNGFQEEDRNWAQLLYTTVQNGGSADTVGKEGSLFYDATWRSHITSGYGYRENPEPGYHKGIDVGMPVGTEICAVMDGTVQSVVYSNTGYGYHIIITHENNLQTLYGHCSELLVSEGQKVTKGTVIALVGSTGKSTGPHCHIEVRQNGVQVDPEPYLP